MIGAGIIAAWAGVRKAAKDLNAGASAATKSPASPAVQAIVGGHIMESTTLLMWSESNRELAEAIESQSRATNYNTEAVRDVCRELSEVRHQIERLRDKMT